MVMMPLCPDCNHAVERHDEFFCLESKCRCNNGKDTALAKYERDVYKYLYEQTLEELSKFINPKIVIQDED